MAQGLRASLCKHTQGVQPPQPACSAGHSTAVQHSFSPRGGWKQLCNFLLNKWQTDLLRISHWKQKKIATLFCSNAWTPFVHPQFRSMNHSCRGIRADKVLCNTLKNYLQKYGSNDANPRDVIWCWELIKIFASRSFFKNCCLCWNQVHSLSLEAKLVCFFLGNEVAKVHFRYCLSLFHP